MFATQKLAFLIENAEAINEVKYAKTRRKIFVNSNSTYKKIIVCFYFYKYRRLLPLVISHGLYDGLQFAFFVIQFRHL